MSGIVGGINLRSSGLVNISSATDGQVFTGTGAGLPVGFEAAAGGGKVQQIVYVLDGAYATGTGYIPWDDTIPQNTEGYEVMTKAITPTSATNLLKIEVIFVGGHAARGSVVAALFQDTTANCLTVARLKASNVYADRHDYGIMTYVMVAGTTSSTTFKVRIGADSSAAVYFNGNSGGRKYGGASKSGIIITEITP